MFYGEDGVLQGFKATGHALFSKKGFDIVCSAASVLFKTALVILKKMQGIVLIIDANRRGSLEVTIRLKQGIRQEERSKTLNHLSFIAEFLTEGINAITSEYPEFVSLELKK